MLEAVLADTDGEFVTHGTVTASSVYVTYSPNSHTYSDYDFKCPEWLALTNDVNA